MSTTSVADMLRHGVHRNMVRPAMHPVLAQTLDHVCGNWSLSVFQRLLYEPFERARQLNPHLTFREFVATSPLAKYVLQAMLGEDGYILVSQTSGAAYFAARARVLAAVRAGDTPIRQWLNWGHWGSQPVAIDITGSQRPLPVDFPVKRYVDGRAHWSYPDFNSQGRPRLFQNHAYVELLRRLPDGTQIPAGGGAAKLLGDLAMPYDPTPRPITGIPELEMSNLQVARMLQTGQSPAHRAVALDYDQDIPDGYSASDAAVTGRAATDARWELASRWGDPQLVNVAYFRRNAGFDVRAGNIDAPTPASVGPGDPVALLSDADLVAMGRWDQYCKKIAYSVFEVEHSRGQRSVDMMQELLTSLNQVADVNLISHLCGLCDPHNLLILTPAGHAATDFHAAFRPNITGGWSPGSSRLGAPVYANPEDHPGYGRMLNVFIDFSPYHLEPVAYMLRDLSVMQAVQVASPEVREAYNEFAECIRAAMRAYEMDPGLMPMQLVNGEWK